jgi:hypothetical protein
MKVIAKAGTKCPKEGNPREYITDAVAEDVPVSIYYLRLINDGSLERKDQADGEQGSGEATVASLSPLPDDKAPSPFVPLPPGERGRGEGSFDMDRGEGAASQADRSVEPESKPKRGGKP